MTTCAACGSSTPEGSSFCPDCGARQTQVAPGARSAIPGDPAERAPSRVRRTLDPAPDPEGETLDGRYRVTRRLDGGGMATVYEAHDLKLERTVAVKVPHPHLLANPEAVTRFEREVRNLVRFDHPGIVKVYDVGHWGRSPYMVMQHLPGGSLQARLERAAERRQTAADVAQWLPGLARALDSLHADGLIHRDVKPANVLFDAAGVSYLADFGVSKALQVDEAALTATHAGIGSPYYMAPEQIGGQPATAAADQYGLAATIYDALSGAPVFGSEPSAQVLLLKMTADPTPIRELVPDLPADAAEAVTRALRREPDKRFATCAAFADAFCRPLLERAAPPAADGDLLGGRYRLVREIGRGATGTVHLAQDTYLDDLQVAVKVPTALLASSPTVIKALKRETRLARRLVHPHIVPLRSFERSQDGVFLVMDYVPGQSLEARLAEKGTLSEFQVRRLFAPLAEALDFAHEQGVVHRDVKPSNVLLDEEDRPHLADFGIAGEMRDTLTRNTGQSSTSGTLPYMSPEQVRGQPPQPAQDVYSLAATMYECLAGHPPFHRGPIEWQIVNEAPTPPTPTQTPLARSILAGLAKTPEDRPPTCHALLHTAPPLPAAAAPEIEAPPWSEPAKDQIAAARNHGVPVAFENDLGMQFVLIPGGTYWMGSPGNEPGRNPDEGRHQVTLSQPYYMQVTPVTNAQYRDFDASHRSGAGFDADEQPVVRVSWADATAFAEWLSGRDRHRRYVLPTEAQWERACRAGSDAAFGCGDVLFPNHAVYGGAHGGGQADPDPTPTTTAVVGSHLPNRWDLSDMHGNCWEWCADWYGPYNRSPEAATEPVGPAAGKERVLRGGAWDCYPANLRSAFRLREKPDARYPSFSFRLAVPLATSRPR